MVLDGVGEREVVIPGGGHVAVLHQGVVEVPVECLLHVGHILHLGDAAHTDLLPLLDVSLGSRHGAGLAHLTKMSKLLKLITFDCTETLMMFHPPVAQKYTESAEKFGISIGTEDLLSHFRVQFKALTNPSIKNHKALEQLASFLIEEYQTNRCWALADGACDILDMLKQKNISIGAISNTDERLENTLMSLKIHSYFDFVLTSYSAGVMKPDKQIFDLARSQINGHVSPGLCAHVGNSLKFDYLGAQNAGWNPIYVGPVDDEVLRMAASNTVFNNLAELHSYLEKVLPGIDENDDTALIK
ncbi:hypothetical protein FOCC_FOCC003024 [Frankliniella occidentalis]|nr:hypothetical protein FOCC_FOCC003024 [Frankliniella occidentalis]